LKIIKAIIIIVGNQSAFLGGVEGTVNGADLKKEGPHGEKLHQNREIADT